ncbi:MAG TPA: hypothetical protein VKW06_09215 [Candidatus Angelobacter sp.]|nr:hypothetical protein [Candidatus Angelobacter sp.]
MVEEAQIDEGGPAGAEEPAEKYLYYRRCSQLRKNGEQCKGPAMKGETVCYSHFNQAELARFRNRQRQNLLGALANQAGAGCGPEVNRALQRINSAVFLGHIDVKTAGKLILEVQKIVMEARRREQAPRRG